MVYYKYYFRNNYAYSNYQGGNMKKTTVSLFGHREIQELRELEKMLMTFITELIKAEPYVSFLIGRNGEFDVYAASVIKRAQKALGRENCELVLVLPYLVSDFEFYEKYYDDIIIPEAVFGAYSKAAIELRNRWMVEQSDILLFYVERNFGGAHKAMKYAEKLNKRIINLFEKL